MDGTLRHIDIVLNPAAGRGAARRARPRVERALAARGVAFAVHETAGPGHAAELAAGLAAAGARIVAAVGGDGTIHEVANGLLRAAAHDAALGIVPVGTGNDFVKVVSGIRSLEDACDALARGTPRPLDAGLATWDGGEEWFVNAMGTGIDVEVVRQIRGIRNLPVAAVYITGLVKALVRFRPIPLHVRIDGVETELRAMIVAVANGSCIGGSFRISPGARPDDGLLDVVLVEEIGLLEVLRVVPRIVRGTHIGHRAVRHSAARRVELEVPAGTPLYFQLDGELREPAGARRVAIEIRPGALRVLGAPGAAPSATASSARAEAV